MDLKKIKSVMKLVKESELDEFYYKEGETEIKIVVNPKNENVSVPVSVPVYTRNDENVVKEIPKENKAVKEKKSDKKAEFKEIKSPIPGNFYRAPAPGAKPFVEIGDVISEGDVVCIIESMKLMNEIKSPFSGKVVDILVENGKPVEKEQTIILID